MSVTPRFTFPQAAALAREIFGVSASVLPLPSERDQNFALTSDTGEQYVLKIAKSDEDWAVLDLQNAALKHVARCRPSLAVSRVVPTLDGTDIAMVRDSSGRSFFVRLLTWLDGAIFVHAGPRDRALLESLGTALASLDAALLDFQHSAMRRQLHWDLRHISLALTHLPLLAPSRQALVRHFQKKWEVIRWDDMRASVIHGDPNDYNVLVHNGKVSGFLDFGDLVHSSTVCDLAIALAYAMLDQPNPLAAAVDIAKAYQRELPLEQVEIEALFPLITSRLCMSVCYAAYNSQAKSEDPYQTVTAEPAWRLLKHLALIPEQEVHDQFYEAFLAY